MSFSAAEDAVLDWDRVCEDGPDEEGQGVVSSLKLMKYMVLEEEKFGDWASAKIRDFQVSTF